MRSPVAVCMLFLVFPSMMSRSPALADPGPETGPRLVAAARELLGQPYHLGGRLRGQEGIDCQGLLFYAAERVGRCGWRSFSVMPTESIPRGELGRSVEGLSPVATADLAADELKGKLAPGDVLWLLADIENPAEPSLVKLGELPVWVWHTALYTGEGRFIHADPFAGTVTEEPLIPFLEEYGYAGVWVTRMTTGPSPRRCRRHAKMPRPTL